MNNDKRSICLGRMYFPVKTLGPGNRVGIWTIGCNRNCKGCISPELRDYDESKKVTIEDILEMINRIEAPIDGFTISGGEPFFDPVALRFLVESLRILNDDILIFTGYTLEELRARNDEDIDTILDICSAIVDGEYIEELNDSKGLRGSSNQKIHIINHFDKYKNIEYAERQLQAVVYDGRILQIGIPRGK